MPDTPTPFVKGQVVSLAALQASMSTSSLAPAASMSLLLASTARAGSFCLFSENGVVWLPVVTRDPPVTTAYPGAAAASASASTDGTTASFKALIDSPLFQPDGDAIRLWRPSSRPVKPGPAAPPIRDRTAAPR